MVDDPGHEQLEGQADEGGGQCRGQAPHPALVGDDGGGEDRRVDDQWVGEQGDGLRDLAGCRAGPQDGGGRQRVEVVGDAGVDQGGPHQEGDGEAQAGPRLAARQARSHGAWAGQCHDASSGAVRSAVRQGRRSVAAWLTYADEPIARAGAPVEEEVLVAGDASGPEAPRARDLVVPGPVPWSGWRDLNPRPLRPERSALPNCATPRVQPAQHSGVPAEDGNPTP